MLTQFLLHRVRSVLDKPTLGPVRTFGGGNRSTSPVDVLRTTLTFGQFGLFRRPHNTGTKFIRELQGNYAKLTEKDIGTLVELARSAEPQPPPTTPATAATVSITSPDQLRSYNTDWTGEFHGNASLCLRPSTVAGVASILAYCHERNLAVTPQGGNTGLVGGSVPVFDEIILSLSRMNRILEFDEEHSTITVEAGVTLGRAEQHCRERGFCFPLDLGAKDSCQIGGNLSTNAGGSRYVRYGSLHGTVLGLEAVLADGTILDLGVGRKVRKDNTGYDLKHLFIGAEGTLGIITKATLSCSPAPTGTQVALAGLPGPFEQVRWWLREARRSLNAHLCAFEFMDNDAMTLLRAHGDGFGVPLQGSHAFYVLIECGTAADTEHRALSPLETYLDAMTRADPRVDVIMAQDLSQSAHLWGLRESLPELVRRSGPSILKYDLSLPLPSFYGTVEAVRERLRQHKLDARTFSWGHVADGNLHLNVSSEHPRDMLRSTLEPWLYDVVQQHGGSGSAEHGIGVLKTRLLERGKRPEVLQLMRRFKALLDPKGILNPYKMVDAGDAGCRRP